MYDLHRQGDAHPWNALEDLLKELDPNFEYIPGEIEWYIYLIECKEEDLTLIKLQFPLVHMEPEGLVSFSPHRNKR